ncbi:MAG: M28 family peptidase [Elainellaceae cyanobacterium]
MSRTIRLGLLALAVVILVAVHPAIRQEIMSLPLTAWGGARLSASLEGDQSTPAEPDRGRPSVGEVLGPSDLQLMLEAVSTERFQHPDRERVRNYITTVLSDLGWVVTRQPVGGGDKSPGGNAGDPRRIGVNLIATRPDHPIAGSLIVGAHYDAVSQSPGADDNGTGVVAVLEAARLLGSLSAPQSLTLVFFDLEEDGLLGSQAFVDEFPNVAGAVILEMLGFRCDQPGCQRYPAGLPATPSQATGNFLAAVGDRAHLRLVDAFRTEPSAGSMPVLALAVPTLGPLAPDLLRSDHVPFWRAGIGAVMLTDTAEFRNPHYHQPSDRVQTIDLIFFQSAVQLVVDRVEQILWRP